MSDCASIFSSPDSFSSKMKVWLRKMPPANETQHGRQAARAKRVAHIATLVLAPWLSLAAA
jgi:hypothetical protein